MNLNGRKNSCGFEKRCANFHSGKNGNCIVEMDDVLDCWVDTTDPKTLSEDELKGYLSHHGLSKEDLEGERLKQ